MKAHGGGEAGVPGNRWCWWWSWRTGSDKITRSSLQREEASVETLCAAKHADALYLLLSWIHAGNFHFLKTVSVF